MNLPCLITSIRILATLIMLFTQPFSSFFYSIYTLSGITDIADGYVARKINQTSEFGARLDSVADIVFYSVMVYKLFSVLWVKVPSVVWTIAFTVAGVRVLTYILAAVKYKTFASLHTYMNKFTGLLFFLIPYAVNLNFFVIFCIFVCIVGTVASLEELVIHIKSKYYNPSVKSLIQTFEKERTTKCI